MIGKLHGLKKDLKTRAFRLLDEISATGGFTPESRKNYENVKELVVETADLIRLTLGGRRSTA
jgi:hypothetical protein